MSAGTDADTRRASAGQFLVRLSPVLCLALASVAYVFHVESADAYPWRNALPLLLIVGVAWCALRAGRGRWAGNGWKWPLATIGFGLPVAGLILYMHYGIATDLNGIYSNAVYPDELFRFLPIYACVAGLTGFAIGWIIGRSADESAGRARKLRDH